MAKKKKILMLSDDLRMHSGVATMTRELVLGTVHKYHWVQMAGAIKNPDCGKVMDLSQATKDLIKQGKIKSDDDVYVKLYPVDGYGNEEILYAVIAAEQPDAIIHFTDPRFWGWLYALEGQLRKKIPLIFLDIWDDLPYPMYNRPYYESCDALFAISKQTDNINLWVRGAEDCCRTYGLYDKHGNIHISYDFWKNFTKKAFNEDWENSHRLISNRHLINSISDIEYTNAKNDFIKRIKKRLNNYFNCNDRISDEDVDMITNLYCKTLDNLIKDKLTKGILEYNKPEIIKSINENIEPTASEIAGSFPQCKSE